MCVYQSVCVCVCMLLETCVLRECPHTCGKMCHVTLKQAGTHKCQIKLHNAQNHRMGFHEKGFPPLTILPATTPSETQFPPPQFPVNHSKEHAQCSSHSPTDIHTHICAPTQRNRQTYMHKHTHKHTYIHTLRHRRSEHTNKHTYTHWTPIFTNEAKGHTSHTCE